MCKDDWLMRPGDHGRTVIMAVPPTAHAMSGDGIEGHGMVPMSR